MKSTDIMKEQIGKFDTINDKENNKTGMVYKITSDHYIIRTAKGLHKVTKSDAVLIPNF